MNQTAWEHSELIVEVGRIRGDTMDELQVQLRSLSSSQIELDTVMTECRDRLLGTDDVAHGGRNV